jgi:hypothetical protein
MEDNKKYKEKIITKIQQGLILTPQSINHL